MCVCVCVCTLTRHSTGLVLLHSPHTFYNLVSLYRSLYSLPRSPCSRRESCGDVVVIVVVVVVVIAVVVVML